MSELFDEDEEKALINDEEIPEAEHIIMESSRQRSTSDARRRLELLMEEKRLRLELEDFL